MHLLPDRVGELKRVYVVPAARGRGLAARLMANVETIGREHGVTTLRLDTRGDLVEARRLYARLGFVEVPAFNDGPYAEHWLAKALLPAAILISADELPSVLRKEHLSCPPTQPGHLMNRTTPPPAASAGLLNCSISSTVTGFTSCDSGWTG